MTLALPATRRLAAFHSLLAALAVALAGLIAQAGPASAQVTAFKQAIAEAAAQDDALSAFYRERDYEPIWVGKGAADRERRAALLSVGETAQAHGLPAGRYDAKDLEALMKSAQTIRDLGRIEVQLSQKFLQFARDIGSGILVPSRIDSGIVRDIPRRDRRTLLENFAASDPTAYLRGLAPNSPEYGRLLKEKMRLEKLVRAGGWGPTVPAQKMEQGDSGPAVVALRNRLIAMGYMGRSASQSFDGSMALAVRAFQKDHGLVVDGIAGGNTTREINVSASDRLGQVLVAMERERWLPRNRGKRHIWVNLTDFTAKIIDDGQVTFETRAVVGKDEDGRMTPEFSDVMEHMVVNPSWYVPRSIVVKEYLPQLQKNPYALDYLEIVDRNGRPANRAAGFTQYNASNFPFSMRQPPSQRNALGQVKFMFPNKYNIYLHDTPAQSLFARDRRAFSHGCVRLNDPFDFAYALLAPQTDDPEGMFQAALNRGKEQKIELEPHVPVHLVYRTAITKPTGGMEYRDDIYGRDAKILAALLDAGVVMPRGES